MRHEHTILIPCRQLDSLINIASIDQSIWPFPSRMRMTCSLSLPKRKKRKWCTMTLDFALGHCLMVFLFVMQQQPEDVHLVSSSNGTHEQPTSPHDWIPHSPSYPFMKSARLVDIWDWHLQTGWLTHAAVLVQLIKAVWTFGSNQGVCTN